MLKKKISKILIIVFIACVGAIAFPTKAQAHPSVFVGYFVVSWEYKGLMNGIVSRF